MDLLLNWLWQGGLVAVAAAAVLRVIPRARPQARYWFVWAACAAVLALPSVPDIFAAASVQAVNDSVRHGPIVGMPTTWWTSTALATGLWYIWCAIYAARLVAATVGLRESKRTSRELPPRVEARLDHWMRVKATSRRTRVVLSTRVRSAAVLGCGAPVIALAPALLTQLNDADIDRVVIHEWAHVQRRDDIAQLVQLLVRMVAGWHPAVWWLQRQIDVEREVACDEIAVAVTGSAKEYATCLTTLAALASGQGNPFPALSAMSSSGLRRRLARILAMHRSLCMRPWRAIAICASVAVATLALTVGNLRVVAFAASAPSLRNAPPTSTNTIAIRSTTGSAPDALAGSGARSVRIRRSPPSSESVGTPNRDNNTPRAPRSETTTIAASSPSASIATRSSAPVDVAIASSVNPLILAEAPIAAPLEARSFAADPAPRADVQARAPWTALADTGVAVGRHYQDAGVATAGFFSRFGKKIAAAF